MSTNHLFTPVHILSDDRKSRFPGLIATLCLTAAGLLAIGSASRRSSPSRAAPVVVARVSDETEADRERRRDEMDRRQAELIEKLERMLDVLSAAR